VTREILTALAAGLASAVLYLSMRTGSPGAILLAYLAPLPLVFVGLFAGWIWTGVAGITALAGIAACWPGPDRRKVRWNGIRPECWSAG
jgi:hypothetical protein